MFARFHLGRPGTAPAFALALILCLAASLHTALAAAPAGPPPIERFFNHPVLSGAKLSPSARYQARDGMAIPALLTLPAGGARKAPLVVLVHGGPYVHGNHWGWNPETQFLASRGYAVLEPDFRGSTGYGDTHFRAGWKQWGLAMQDDIADGARWAIAQGLAGPKRICIAGASYSPIQQAARIKAPLLLAYGDVDRRVPMFHGRKFLDAVKPGNSQVEWIEYQDEGHGWQLPANRVDFWSRVEKFLDRHIGKP